LDRDSCDESTEQFSTKANLSVDGLDKEHSRSSYIDQQNVDGLTPLMIAGRDGYEDKVEHLLQH
jgi:hypothetical protein